VFLGAKIVDKQKGLILLELLMCSLHRAIYFPDEHNVVWTELLKREMTLQIAQGMTYLHTTRPQITHGDMKPASGMLTNHFVCRIVDIGLSLAKVSSYMASKAGNGTLHYQAPELLETDPDVKSDHKIDAYAYALTILELFQQQPPYPNALAEVDLKAMVLRGGRPGVDCKLVPIGIVELINVAWQQNKDQRPEFSAIVAELTGRSAVVVHAAGGSSLTNSTSASAVYLECDRKAAKKPGGRKAVKTPSGLSDLAVDENDAASIVRAMKEDIKNPTLQHQGLQAH
jgi:serine/threonine protein kinase